MCPNKSIHQNLEKRNEQGIGVRHFATHLPANRFMYEKSNLSSSEWVTAVKLSTNYANLAGVRGAKNKNPRNTRCRHCGYQKETPSHVLGKCDFGNKQRIARHHRVKHRLNSLLSQNGYTCFDEAWCTDSQGSEKRADIIAFANKSKKAYVIDPTVRFETSDDDLDEKIQEEKEMIYRDCFADLEKRYPKFGKREWKVIGLWFGARGTISKSVQQFFADFGLPTDVLPEIAESVLSDSIHILNRHIYTQPVHNIGLVAF